MHIAFLTSEYPHPKVSRAAGIATSLKNLVTNLIDKKVDVTVIVYAQDTNEVFYENGINFHLVKHRKYRLFGWYFYRKYLEKYCNRIINAEGINLIESADWTGITAFMNFSIPLIIRLHGSDAYFCALENRSQKMKNFIFEKIALKNADYLISVSRFTADLTKKIFSLQNEIIVINNGIDITKFSPIEEESDQNTILYFGSIIRKKGVLDLILAFKLAFKNDPNIQLVLIGKDTIDVITGKSTLKLIYENLTPLEKKAINYKSHLPYDDIVSEIGKATVVVLPSYAEAFPMTWLEAMAMGKALITSNIGWADEIVEHEITGLTVYPANHNTMAEFILRLLRNNEIRKSFGAMARKKVTEKFSASNLAAENIKFYNEVLL